MNPVRQFKVDLPWEVMNHSAMVKPPEEGFGRLFDTVRSEREQSIRVRPAERKPGQQERLERWERDDQGWERDFYDEAPLRIENNEAQSPSKSDEIQDSAPSDMDQEEQPVETAENQTEVPVDDTNPDNSNDGEVQESAAAPAATGETETASVVNVGLADKMNQSSGPLNTAADVAVKGQQGESAPVNNGWNVKVQKPVTAELVGPPNQAKSANQGRENGLSGEKVNMTKQLFAEEEGDEAAKILKQGAGGSKEMPGVQATKPSLSKEISDQRAHHLEVLNKTTQDQSVIMGESESNASPKGESQKAQTTVTQKEVFEGFGPIKNDQAFSGQGFGGRNSHEPGALERAWSNQGKGEVDIKAGQVNRGVNVTVMKGGEGTNSADMQENVDRVVKAARASINNNSARIQIRLEPPELGYLRVELKQGGTGWHLLIQATNVRAQQMLQQNSGDLQAALEAHGIPTKQIDIQLRLDLNNDQAPDQSQEDYQQQSWSHQADSQDRSHGDGLGQRGAEPSPAPDEIEAPAAGSAEAAAPSWRELEFSRLDVHA